MEHVIIAGHKIEKVDEHHYKGRFCEEQGCEYIYDPHTQKWIMEVYTWGSVYDVEFDTLEEAVKEGESYT